MKKTINHWQRIIEDTNWDNELLEQENRLNAACWLIVLAAVLFFGMVIVGILTR